MSGSLRLLQLGYNAGREGSMVRSVSILLVLLGLATALGAQRSLSLEQQVIATDEERMDALRRGDPAPLQRIYADDYTLVTGLGQVRSKADQLNELKSGALRYASIRSVERQVRLYGDVVVVVSRQQAEIFQGSHHITGDERVTRVYKNFDGQWKVISTHATPIR
jgi:uncharacterized protein (TIGR02246 family)